MPKKKATCDDGQLEWFEGVMERIKAATGARTQVQLAETLDVRQSSISDAKRRCSIPSDWILKLFRTHGLNPDWLQTGTDPCYLDSSKGKIPADKLTAKCPINYAARQDSRGIIVAVSSLAGTDKSASTWKPDIIQEVSIPGSFVSCVDHIALKIDNDSMEPILKNGAFIGINLDKNDIADGSLCAVFYQHQGVLIRRVYMRGDHFLLRTENEKYSELTIEASKMAEHMVGLVIWMMKKI